MTAQFRPHNELNLEDKVNVLQWIEHILYELDSYGWFNISRAINLIFLAKLLDLRTERKQSGYDWHDSLRPSDCFKLLQYLEAAIDGQ